MDNKVQGTMKALNKNNIDTYYVDKKEDVVAMVSSLLEDGQTVTNGGSMTLAATGVMDLLRSGKYDFRDRDNASTMEERAEIQRQAFSVDTFLCSSNAVTEKGELYNVDGIGNRVAAIAWGPKSVIMVVSTDKIVKDLDEAILRVKKNCAPNNAKRLNCETYCLHKGECQSFGDHPEQMTSGCNSDARICSDYLVSGFQRHKGRIKIVFVGESVGY